jgi:glycosyltransferase involved in cell wall biosynthesis
MRLRFFGTGAIGLAIASIVLAAIAVLIEGPGSVAAEEASIVGFVWFGAGVIALLIAVFSGDDRRPAGPVVDDPLVERASEFAYTIVIPIYNRPALLIELVKRIESLLPAWQRCGAGEIVVVDDGSTDSTPAVATRLAEQSTLPMRVVSQANKGVSGARNRGFWEARGAVAVVIDSDCLPDEAWLPAMLDAVDSRPGTLAFATIYSDRGIRYPLEASPSGAQFAGASFAMRVPEYIRMGGNCEEFSGASRDDSDLVLTARAAGFTPITVREATVWHPIRSQTPRGIFRTGLHHRFDNLLAKRHGERALAFIGDPLLGGSFAGHYPTSLVLYAYIMLAIYDLLAGVMSGTGPHIISLAEIFIVLLVGWLLAQAIAARMLHIPFARFWGFVRGNFAHVFGVAAGRLQGIWEFRLVLF